MSSPDPDFPITAAQLSGNFCETLFYGMYLVTFTICGHTLLYTGTGAEERLLRVHEIRWMMVSIALALFSISTFDVAIGLLHNFHAFIKSSNPTTELLNIADWINIARTVNQVIAMLLGDFVLIYRCWVVHGRRWLVIAPSLVLYLAGISMAGKLIQVEADPRTQRAISLNSDQIRPWWLSFFAITACQNTLTTSILIWRIWRVDSRSSLYRSQASSIKKQPRHLQNVIRAIAESGAAYTLMVVLTFIVSISQNNALYPMSDMTLQATGIAFNVIIVRSSARRDQQFTVFDHNDRTLTVLDQRAAASTTVGSTNPAHHRGHSLSGMPPEDLEMDVKSIRSPLNESQEADIYPGRIMVTKSVHTS